MKRSCLTIIILLCALAVPATPGADDHNHNATPLFAGLGNHHHLVTTKSDLAQKYFNQGLIFVYAFNHAEAVRSFREAARLDPDCAMAYWGVVLALGPNINRAYSDVDLTESWPWNVEKTGKGEKKFKRSSAGPDKPSRKKREGSRSASDTAPVIRSVELPNRVTLQYVEQGDPRGVPVILLHGYTDSLRSFDLVLPRAAISPSDSRLIIRVAPGDLCLQARSPPCEAIRACWNFRTLSYQNSRTR